MLTNVSVIKQYALLKRARAGLDIVDYLMNYLPTRAPAAIWLTSEIRQKSDL